MHNVGRSLRHHFATIARQRVETGSEDLILALEEMAIGIHRHAYRAVVKRACISLG